MMTTTQTRQVVTLKHDTGSRQVPGIPCDECGNLADQQVDGMGSDRYWYCTYCGEVSREGLNVVGGPMYPGAAEPKSDDDSWKEQTDINDYCDEDGVIDDDTDGDTQSKLDRWM